MSQFDSQDFLQDFLQEAGEHLEQARRHLLELEELDRAGRKTAGEKATRAALIDDLFRSFHTLKSLCGMTGLEPGARLAHALESALDGLRKGRIQTTPRLLDGLFHAANTLSEMVETVRDPSAPMPDTRLDHDLLEQFAQRPEVPVEPPEPPSEPMFPAGTASSAETVHPAGMLAGYPRVAASFNETDWLRLQDALERGLRLSLAIFAPSNEKSRQGITVTQAREQLAHAGELIKAVPLIDGALVRFALVTASTQPLDRAGFPEMEWHELTAIQSGKIPAASLPPRTTVSSTGLVRVEMRRLEDLLRQAGDLSVTHWRLTSLMSQLEGAPASARQDLRRTLERMERNLRDLRASILRARLVPLAEAFGPMPLAVRDLARAMQKEAHVVMEGEETEIDKDVVERLLNPLLHLVRNAVAHGIEPPADREQMGKPSSGTVTLRGKSEGDTILITVADDGAGISLPSVAARAAELGWLSPGVKINEEEALAILCRPGFSTQKQSDLSAGRGVGMDVARRSAQAMGGSLSMRSESGKGTAFTLRLPLTLLMARVILVRAGPETYAVPIDRVEELFEIEAGAITRLESGEIYSLRGTSIALRRLADLLHLPSGADGQPERQYGLSLRAGDHRTALVVDRLLGIRDVVVRTLSDPLLALPGIAGATELSDGSVALILNVQEWTRSA